MRLTRRAAFGGLAATLIAAPFAASPLAAATLEKVRAKGTLRVSLYQDFAPWSSRVDGRLVGIDVELAAAFAETLGVKPDFWDFAAGEDMGDDLRDTVWRGPLLGGQVADVMMHVPTDPRFAATVEQVAIVAPYYRESFAMACGREVDCEAPPVSFKGRPLAAELDSVPDFYLMGSFGGALRADVRHLNSGLAALEEIGAGRAAMGVATRAQIEHAVSRAPDRLVVRRAPLPEMTSAGWDVGLAVKADSRDLGDALAATMRAMAGDGRLAAIFARHGVTPRPPVAV